MTSTQAILLLLCGEICKSLPTAAAPVSVSASSAPYTSAGSPTGDTALPYQPHTTGPSSRRALTAAPGQFPTAKAEPVDDSWVAALVIGIILISMITSIVIIVLWKSCRRPVPVDPNWAGRSPFADGDTPDVFLDSDQAPKRSSVLFMLPWKLKQDTNPQKDPPAAEKPPACASPDGTSPLPPAAEGCSADRTAAASVSTSPAPSPAPAPCPPAAASPQIPELPPPPDWLREPAEHCGADLCKQQGSQLETEEQPPPAPQELGQEPPPQLPQPQHPL
ncbi:EVI2B protein, partial [Rhinopomastus cyanomelas]|nr:EVI2B protein [Rhinopomastus cyanomelas]